MYMCVLVFVTILYTVLEKYLNILATINRQFLFLYLQRERDFQKHIKCTMQLSITIIFFFLETKYSMEIDEDRDNMFLKIE